ncbi:MAG: methylated-DNA--[protein]-cysteine S-methyltransferase [bacterium]
MRTRKEPTARRLVAGSPLGPLGILWRPGPRVLRIELPGRRGPAAPPGTCPAVTRLAGDICRFLAGEPVRFGLALLALETCPPFQRAVLEAEHRIPRGRVSSYRRLAEQVGRPGAARAVGSALARNPFPVIIPCHRAVRSDGALGGFQGGLAMKRTLLEIEGVGFDPSGRVRPEHFR